MLSNSLTVGGYDISASCTVTVLNSIYHVHDIDAFESNHYYGAGSSDWWIYNVDNASEIEIAFDSRTKVTDGVDYINIYDAEDSMIGSYTGTELSGKKVSVPGDIVKIQIISNGSGNEWGFKVTNVSSEIKTGWCTVDGNTYYYDSDGHLLKGLQKILNDWYYFDAYGAMQTGWFKIDGKWYYFNESGIMEEKPGMITGLKAKSAGKNKVRLSWDVCEDAEGYLVYGKRTSSGTYGYIGMTSNTFYTDTKALDTEYNFYWVYPYIKQPDKYVTGKCPNYVYAKGVTAAVTGARAQGAGKGVVMLTWDAVTDADGYIIYGKRGSNGTYGYITMTNGNTYVKDTKAPDNEYSFYWIYSFHLDSSGKRVIGTSPKTYIYAKGITVPVNDLKAASVTGGVKLTWGAVSDAAGYIIYAKRPGDTSFSYISMTTKNLTYTDKQASKTDWTFYRVFPFHLDANGKRVIGESGNYTYGKAK